MKILQVIPYFCFGGAETMCENLTYGLLAQGHQVTVVSMFPDRTVIARRMEEAGVRILYLDKKMGLDLSMIKKLVDIMKAEKPDVVHTHLNVIKYAALAAKLAGVKKCLHTVHNVAEEECEGILQKISNTFYFRHHWSVPVALSPLVKQTISDFYGMGEDCVPIVYNGVDLSRCLPKDSYAAGETLKLIHVGRFNEQKNHECLLKAYAMFRERFPASELILLGEGERMEQMKALAEELGISDSVRFMGAMSNVYPILREADIFLLPSRYEGMPMTIIEAMGTGLPIVASAVGGVPDMIEHNVSGLLTRAEPQDVCDACIALAEDENLRSRLGRQAKQDGIRFGADYMTKRYLEEYSK